MIVNIPRGSDGLSFHTLGCSGCYEDGEPGSKVAAAMVSQLDQPDVYDGAAEAIPASFLFHLGDICYRAENKAKPEGKDWAALYNTQFYAQFSLSKEPAKNPKGPCTSENLW